MGDGKQPDGLTLLPWTMGRHLVWDVTCRDTLCQSYVYQTSKKAGKAAEKGEEEKIAKYRELEADYIVQPVAMETLGSWGESSRKFIEELGARITLVSGDKKETSQLFQKISMAVQKGNVISIRGSLPNPRSFNEYYCL